MKKGLLILLLGIIFTMNGYSQTSRLVFTYIAHSTETPVVQLCNELRSQFDFARNYRVPTVFYLANMKMPLIAKIAVGEEEDDVETFDRIIKELQERRFHSVDSKEDVNQIVSLFNQYDFVDDNDSPKYKEMEWNFFIDQAFWDLKYNEKIIATLYYTLDIENYASDFLRLRVFYSGDRDELIFDEANPYGLKNICPNINIFERLKF